ncbi:FAD/NAD(P)-binding oxidoreductase, partial [Marinomonas sp. 15G1-11]
SRGHEVVLFEAKSEVGGQFNLARKIPGKEEFNETIRYFINQIKLHNIDLRLNTKLDASVLATEKFDEVVISSGVVPRRTDTSRF